MANRLTNRPPSPGGRDKSDGFRCKYCHSHVNKVTNTWTYTVTYYGQTKTLIKRRRVCVHCGLYFTTIETVEDETNPGNPELVTPPPIPPPIEPPKFIKPNKSQTAANTSPKEKRAAAKRKKGDNPYV